MAALNFPTERPDHTPLQPGDQYTGDNNVTYVYDGVKWFGRTPGIAGTSSLSNNGHIVQVDTTGNLVLGVGTTIVDTDGNPIVGAGGTAGATGATGSTGATGPTGATGAGEPGNDGATGATGTPGDVGATGATGAGEPGNDGATGATGEPGNDGATGATGETGATGAGEPGNDGATGATGPSGNDGATGETGATGVGEPGNDGATGATGTPGDVGATGMPGNDGATGEIGATGASGPGADQDLNTTDAVSFASVSVTGDLTTGSGPNIVFQPNASTAGYTLTFPIDAGDNTQVLSTDGSGNLSWVDQTGGGGGGTGATGPDGATGATGPDGATGMPGNDGATGEMGATGPSGEPGNDGATGEIGATGETGATGEIGATGVGTGTENKIFNGTSYANIASSDGTLTVGVNNNEWLFDVDGTLNFNNGNLIISPNIALMGSNTALIQPIDNLPLISISTGSTGSISSIWIEDYDNVFSSNIAAVYTNPTASSGIVRIAVGQNGGSGPHLWDFGADGTLTLPDGFNINTTTFTNTTMLFGALNGDGSTKNIVLSTGEITNTISIPGTVFANATGVGNTDPVSISGKNGVGITTGSDGQGHDQHTWTFGTDGVLRMPDGATGGDGRIDFSFEGYNWARVRSHNRQVYLESLVDNGPGDPDNGNICTQLSVGTDILLITDWENAQYTWNFGTDGILTFPTATVPTVAEYFLPTLIGTSQISFATYDTEDNANAYVISDQTNTYWETFAEDDATGAYPAWAWIKAALPTVDTPEVFIENKKGSDGIGLRWTFGADGNLTFPDGNLTIGHDPYGDPAIIGAAGKNIGLVSSGVGDGYEVGSSLIWVDSITEPTKMAGVSANNPLFAGAGDVGIVTGDYFYTGNTNVWNFGADGTTTVPGGITMPVETGLYSPGHDLYITAGNTTGCSVPGGDTIISSGLGYGGAANGGGNVTLRTGDYHDKVWNFDFEGNLILPNIASPCITYANGVNILDTVITVSNSAPAYSKSLWYNTIDGRTYINDGATWIDASPAVPLPYVRIGTTEGVDGTVNTVELVPLGGNETQRLVVYPTIIEGDHVHLTTGNLAVTDLYLGDDYQYVKVAADGNVYVGTLGELAYNQWAFDKTGNLTLPNGGSINYANNNSILSSIRSDRLLSPDASKTAQLFDNGNLTLPTVNSEQQTITGTKQTIDGNVFPSAFSGNNVVYSATSTEVWGFKILVRAQTGFGEDPSELELAEITAARNYGGNVSYTISNRVKTDPTAADIAYIAINPSGTMELMADVAARNVYFTYTVTEFNKTNN